MRPRVLWRLRRLLARKPLDDALDWARFRIDTFPRSVRWLQHLRLPELQCATYQELPWVGLGAGRRAEATTMRWARMQPIVEQLGVQSALDLGANVGWVHLYLRSVRHPEHRRRARRATCPHWPLRAEKTRRPERELPRHGLSPQNVRVLPPADCVLLLSVWHHVVRDNGFRAFRDVPLWYDTVMLTTFAGVGVLLGFLSLYLMHTAARRAFGPIAGWVGVTIVLAVAGFGVYLGRFVRFNSWDIVTNPSRLAGDLWQGASNPLAHPWAIAASVVLGVLLGCGYVVAYRLVAVATTRLSRLPDTRA